MCLQYNDIVTTYDSYLSWSDFYVEVVSLVRDFQNFSPRKSVDS